MKKRKCAHLRINIRAILKAWDDSRGCRVLRGSCQDCGQEVEREVTEREIMVGKPQTEWRTAA